MRPEDVDDTAGIVISMIQGREPVRSCILPLSFVFNKFKPSALRSLSLAQALSDTVVWGHLAASGAGERRIVASCAFVALRIRVTGAVEGPAGPTTTASRRTARSRIWTAAGTVPTVQRFVPLSFAIIRH